MGLDPVTKRSCAKKDTLWRMSVFLCMSAMSPNLFSLPAYRESVSTSRKEGITMSGRISPFAALTGAERQIKWLEYQSIRLPYVQGSVDTYMNEADEQAEEPQQAPASAAPMQRQQSPTPLAPSNKQPPSAPAHALSQPQTQEKREPVRTRIQAPVTAASTDFQQTRHRQYDAVIARMKQAELRTNGYNPLS